MKFCKILRLFVKTNARKMALDGPLYKLSAGRSMVEMLGVLAIIGVLSVGAISGYSKAMYRYKLNQSLELYTHMFSLVYRYLYEFKADTFTHLMPYFIKLDEIPENVTKKENNNVIYDKFNMRLSAYINAPSPQTVLQFHRPSGDKQSAGDICYYVMSLAQEYYDSISVVWCSNEGDKNHTYYKGGRLKSSSYKDLREENFLQKCNENKTGAFTAYIFFVNKPNY